MDVTALEAHRRDINSSRAGDNPLSPVPFLLKAVAAVLLELPQFNASLDAATNTIVRRKYVNLGLAIDTSGGLVVGVIRGCDARELDELALLARGLTEKARGRGLTLSEMSGGGFTISSLGAAGGSGFTPIINAPEVAILGVSRLSDAPQRSADGGLVWRSLLPVSLSYDHRVINGADAGRFMRALQSQLDRLAEA
jgi:pyruvate dehydrogenase E2 component (dihydrolipoamide acetyltransferase)